MQKCFSDPVHFYAWPLRKYKEIFLCHSGSYLFSACRNLAAKLQNAVAVTLDIVAIRSRYIQDNLRRALTAGDRLMAWVTAAEFRRYFHWFADTFPEPDKRIIAQQLSKLEEL